MMISPTSKTNANLNHLVRVAVPGMEAEGLWSAGLWQSIRNLDK